MWTDLWLLVFFEFLNYILHMFRFFQWESVTFIFYLNIILSVITQLIKIAHKMQIVVTEILLFHRNYFKILLRFSSPLFIQLLFRWLWNIYNLCLLSINWVLPRPSRISETPNVLNTLKFCWEFKGLDRMLTENGVSLHWFNKFSIIKLGSGI